MGKVSKNARTDRGKVSGGKDFVKVVVSEKNPETGAYTYKEKMIHKDKVEEFFSYL
ncbi:MAG: DUF4295 family protein [Sphingobacteriales bacterium]|nr:DUF4295 family protein [Sphingobacteriales bacterium]